MRMKLDLFGWLFDNNPEPAKLMVIYQDIKDFASSLKDWKARDCNILVAQPEHGQRRRYKCILNHLITQEWLIFQMKFGRAGDDFFVVSGQRRPPLWRSKAARALQGIEAVTTRSVQEDVKLGFSRSRR
uniref:Uncharacterized protein n=1 Tax=Brassica oleracea var. oleracea TaxID=109376 RepID=A0A0D3BWN6_BRAOL